MNTRNDDLFILGLLLYIFSNQLTRWLPEDHPIVLVGAGVAVVVLFYDLLVRLIARFKNNGH